MIRYLSFEKTRKYARDLGIKTFSDWIKIKHPNNIYKRPEITFKNKGWTNWYDFLGKNKNYLSFEETRNYAKTLNLKSGKEWIKWHDKYEPKNIYKHPNISFKNKGWINWNDFLGISKVNFLSFEETRKYARDLDIKTFSDWIKIKHPEYINVLPNKYFKNKGWKNWRDFLGTFDKYLSYEETCKYARSLNFQSSYQWNLQKHPKNIYKHPKISFKNKGWTNWDDFLGI